jgi:hypothetical protein
MGKSVARRSVMMLRDFTGIADCCRARRERPRHRAARQRDELAASDESGHLIPPAGRAREG